MFQSCARNHANAGVRVPEQAHFDRHLDADGKAGISLCFSLPIKKALPRMARSTAAVMALRR
jgi:hypothetical protein